MDSRGFAWVKKIWPVRFESPDGSMGHFHPKASLICQTHVSKNKHLTIRTNQIFKNIYSRFTGKHSGTESQFQ